MLLNDERKNVGPTPEGTVSSAQSEAGSGTAAAPQSAQSGPQKNASMRRSQRVHLRTGVLIYGQLADGNLYQEDAYTDTVNANGAKILIAADVQLHEQLLLVCKQTMMEAECTVVWLGDKRDGKREAGVGFAEPRPRFWGVTFPPDDWDPSQRKLPTGRPR